jgi:hypothetical protein
MDMLLGYGRQEIDVELWWRIVLESARLESKNENVRIALTQHF